MAHEAPARSKIPTTGPRPGRRAGEVRPLGTRRDARGGTGRAATRGGGPVIELERGITVYPAREE